MAIRNFKSRKVSLFTSVPEYAVEIRNSNKSHSWLCRPIQDVVKTGWRYTQVYSDPKPSRASMSLPPVWKSVRHHVDIEVIFGIYTLKQLTTDLSWDVLSQSTLYQPPAPLFCWGTLWASWFFWWFWQWLSWIWRDPKNCACDLSLYISASLCPSLSLSLSLSLCCNSMGASSMT